jgi:uncharacterized membrane protein
VIPPVAGGNERLNFQRSAVIATGHIFIEPTQLPEGTAKLLSINKRDFPEGRQPPYSYSTRQIAELADLQLHGDRPTFVHPNPIAVLNPLSYLPQVPALAIANALNFGPLLAFYLGRLAGLAAATVLTFHAIRIMPVQKHVLAAVAMLPPITFSRSTLDADQFTCGLSFLFVALIARELISNVPIRQGTVAVLATLGLLVAQAKSAYLLLPLLMLVVPQSRFGNGRRKAALCALIALPGLVASLAWILVLKATYFDGIAYRTWSGVVVPSAQISSVLADPLGFLGVLINTLITTRLVPLSIVQFLGVFGPPVTLPFGIIGFVGTLLAAVYLSEFPSAVLFPKRTRLFAAAISSATLVTILTLLYVQWTKVGGRTIDGFNARYLYPLAPLLLLTLPNRNLRALKISPLIPLTFLGSVSGLATLWLTWATYWT